MNPKIPEWVTPSKLSPPIAGVGPAPLAHDELLFAHVTGDGDPPDLLAAVVPREAFQSVETLGTYLDALAAREAEFRQHPEPAVAAAA
jgi:hypothetical protein